MQQQQLPHGIATTASVPWYKDANLCNGVFDGETRKMEIEKYRKLPEEDIAIRVQVAPPGPTEDDQEAKHIYFLCFGFMPGEGVL